MKKIKLTKEEQKMLKEVETGNFHSVLNKSKDLSKYSEIARNTKNTSPKFKSGWCFATVNNRLAEIYFNKKWGLYGYCYVDRREFSKKEQIAIDQDIKGHQFSYRNGFFRDKIKNIVFPIGKMDIEEGLLIRK